MSIVASTLEEALSPEWLSEALSKQSPGTIVKSVTVHQLLHGVGTKALLTLSYASAPEGLPSTLCLKAGFEPHNRHILEGGTYLKEARFYSDIAPSLPLTVPSCYYAGYDSTSKQGILLLEDLRTSGVSFGSAQRGNTPDEAASFIESLAAFHALYWGGKGPVTHPWLRREQVLTGGSGSAIYTDRIRSNFEDGRARTLPPEMTDDRRLLDAWGALASKINPAQSCLVHGDPHAGNLYLTATGGAGFYDWQTIHPSSWAVDVAYYLGAALDHEDRRSSLEGLLRHYLDRLRAHDVEAPSWDEAWLRYRQFLVYGYYMWVITRHIVQPKEVVDTFVDRIGHAMLEADSYAAFDA